MTNRQNANVTKNKTTYHIRQNTNMIKHKKTKQKSDNIKKDKIQK